MHTSTSDRKREDDNRVKKLWKIVIGISVIIGIVAAGLEILDYISSESTQKGYSKELIADDAKFSHLTMVDGKRIAWDTSNIEALLAQPTYFYHKPGQAELGENEIMDRIEEHDEGLSVYITVTNESCNLQDFVMINKKMGRENLHLILPYQEYPKLEIPDWRKRSYYGIGESNSQENKDDMYVGARRETDTCIEETMDGERITVYKQRPPTLSVSVMNNWNKTIKVNSISVDVFRSVKNSFPVFDFWDMTGPDNNLAIFNIGWGKAKHVVMEFSMLDADQKIEEAYPFRYKMKLPDISPSISMDGYMNHNLPTLEKYLAFEGVDVQKFKEGYPELGDTAFGRFSKEGYTKVVGRLSFEGQLSTGNVMRDTVPFAFLHFISPSEIGGIETNRYRFRNVNVRLKNQGTGYSRTFDVNEILKPNEDKVFTLGLFSNSNSYHFFDINIHLSNGKKLTIPNIFLNEFLRHDVYSHRFKESERNSASL